MTTSKFTQTKTTKLRQPSQGWQFGRTLDSLRRAFVSAFRLYLESTEPSIWATARRALRGIRQSAARLFDSLECADEFLMGDYQ